MTQEEKAKRYDEAIERAKKDYEECKMRDNDWFVEYIEEMFPELKESEDEGIIGNIIATIHLYYGEPLEDEAKEMIAWLEKQGQTFTKKDVDDAYLKGVCDAKHEIEKQGKNNMGISEATKKELDDKLHKALEKETAESFNKFLDEQKHADTEKGAKGNNREIPSSAWSEEDELIINKILCICNDFEKSFEISPASTKVIKEDVNKIDNWLKSLKERYTWRPSDEQMDALRYVTNFDYGGYKATLVSLYEQLKKLRGGDV